MSKYRILPTVSMERLDGETIVIDFESGRFYSFRESAADLLWLISLGIELTLFESVLRRYFKIQDLSEVAIDIDSFIETILSLNLIEKNVVEDEIGDGRVTDVELPEDYLRGDWVSPLLVSNDELADLLKIDPIHDVTESGWPESPRS
ncbi:MAG: hypothetical protein WCR08_08990 [Gammaproteobacteria bacterium]